MGHLYPALPLGLSDHYGRGDKTIVRAGGIRCVQRNSICWNMTVLFQTWTHGAYDCMLCDLYKKEPDKIPAFSGETHEVPLPPSKKLLAIGCYWEEGKSVFSGCGYSHSSRQSSAMREQAAPSVLVLFWKGAHEGRGEQWQWREKSE